jgi:hypothetical protein
MSDEADQPAEIEPEVEQMARALALELAIRAGEEEFRSGLLTEADVAAAAAAAQRTAERLWPQCVPEAREIVAMMEAKRGEI